MVRCYAELNDFLPPGRRQAAFAAPFTGRVAIKDLLEALGVPHPEIDLLLANGEPVDFSYLVRDGDRIGAYPPFTTLDVTALTRVRPAPLPEPRFVLDTHLGKLAGYLRMLGFDTRYRNDYADDALARIAGDEGHILLTRDRGLLKRGAVAHGYFVRETAPGRQAAEVLRRFRLRERAAPLQRCLHCNGLLAPVPKGLIIDRLPPATRRHHDDFRACRDCGRIYWPGSHYARMRRFIARLLQQDAAGGGAPR